MTLSTLDGSTALMSTIFGAGLLGIPSAFEMIGSVASIPMFLIFSTLTLVTLMFLASNCEKLKTNSYANMCAEIGKPAEVVLDLCVTMQCYAASFIYAVFIYNNVEGFFPDFKYKKYAIGAVICIIFYLLLLLKSLDKLKFASKVTFGATIFIAVLFIYYAFALDIKSYTFPGKSAGKGFGIVVFALGCQQSGPQIYGSLKNKTLKNGLISFATGILAATSIYVAVGYLGKVVIGDDVGDNFLKKINSQEFIDKCKNTFDKKGILPKLATLAFVFTLFVSFAFQSFVGKGSVIKMIGRGDGFGTLVNLCQVIICFLFISFEISGGKLMSLIGGTCGSLIGFILPPLSFMKCHPKSQFYYPAAIISVLAIFMMFYVLYPTVKGMLF